MKKIILFFSLLMTVVVGKAQNYEYEMMKIHMGQNMMVSFNTAQVKEVRPSKIAIDGSQQSREVTMEVVTDNNKVYRYPIASIDSIDFKIDRGRKTDSNSGQPIYDHRVEPDGGTVILEFHTTGNVPEEDALFDYDSFAQVETDRDNGRAVVTLDKNEDVYGRVCTVSYGNSTVTIHQPGTGIVRSAAFTFDGKGWVHQTDTRSDPSSWDEVASVSSDLNGDNGWVNVSCSRIGLDVIKLTGKKAKMEVFQSNTTGWDNPLPGDELSSYNYIDTNLDYEAVIDVSVSPGRLLSARIEGSSKKAMRTWYSSSDRQQHNDYEIRVSAKGDGEQTTNPMSYVVTGTQSIAAGWKNKISDYRRLNVQGDTSYDEQTTTFMYFADEESYGKPYFQVSLSTSAIE